MDYLTATEFSKKWGITSRMVARYCEVGRIDGAIKKGKTWLLPANSKRPMDQRRKRLAVKTVKTTGSTLNPASETATYHTSMRMIRSASCAIASLCVIIMVV